MASPPAHARAPRGATSLIYQRSGRIILTGRRPSAVPPGAAVFLELSWSQGGKPSPGRARLEHRLALHFGGYCYQGAIDLAYRLAEAAGVPVWCQDEAGPYQAIPQAGAKWAPVGEPARLPHEYVRGGTAKLLTLFRPATGEVRAKGVTNAPNAVLHPWLQAELTAVLATLPPVTLPEAECRPLARWSFRLGHEPREPLRPPRPLLIGDSLA